MDRATQTLLNNLNARFYRTQAASFSATRQAPWEGWRRSLHAAMRAEAPAAEPLSVLDLACGNLRYARFLAEALPGCAVAYYGVDNADALAAAASPNNGFPAGNAPDGTVAVTYQHLDVVGALVAEQGLAGLITAPPCDLAVCFGFLHHVPAVAARQAVLDALLARTHPGSCVIVSFWQFMNDERLARKARATTADALADLAAQSTAPILDENDYLLGWQGEKGVYRYCHHFATKEVDDLLVHAQRTWGCALIDRFCADGKAGNLNTYLVLQR